MRYAVVADNNAGNAQRRTVAESSLTPVVGMAMADEEYMGDKEVKMIVLFLLDSGLTRSI